MEGRHGSDVEREDDDSLSELLRDRFRLCTISIAESEAKNVGMDLSGPIIACISDLAFKYTELAKDLELFAQHAGRKTVTMDDVILSAHRNEYVAASLRSFSNGLKAKEPQSERKKKRMSKKVDTTASSAHIHDL
ncbi:protein MHF1 homolog isoform X4 [Ricinus communis]|uniref:protein MHF1 homolog isoform X4 n=1 Tax=Ricinus communis TaxID=3988 RepID=UPI000772C051|nr:protein MHF1 homolog isoform X4 [Ricinus communis]|eukprot:XP_015582087.1 protein MHF1 homolog isoform X2 [Ricinus communis]